MSAGASLGLAGLVLQALEVLILPGIGFLVHRLIGRHDNMAADVKQIQLELAKANLPRMATQVEDLADETEEIRMRQAKMHGRLRLVERRTGTAR